MKAGPFLATVIASLIGLFAGLNLLLGATAGSVRLDLTERALYRLSPGALEVMARIDEPISINFVYSRVEAARYPAIRAYGARVRELLRGMAARSGGMVRLEEIDPEPFSEAEDRAIAAGLEPIPTEDGSQLFFGLIGRNTIDDQRVIAFFDPAEEARLEYEIVRVLAELDRARQPSLAIISDLPFAPNGEGRSGNRIIDELAQAYAVSWLERGFTRIPDSDALLILHPGPLSESQLYMIDQYTLRRGRLLVAVDALSHIALKPGPDGLPPIDASRSSSLPRLFDGWGLRFDPTLTVMDRANGLPVQIVEDGRARTRAYPLWFSIQADGMNPDLPAVAALSRGVNLGSPGSLEPAEGARTRFMPVLSTSGDGARLDVDIAAGSPSPDTLSRDYVPAADAPLVIAARISGSLATAFPDGPPASDINFDPGAHLADSRTPAELFVIADTDWLDPAFYTSRDPVQGEQVVADNLSLALNLADALAGDPALVSLRSRSVSLRPMTRVEALRSAAENRYLDLQDQLTRELSDAEAELGRLSVAGTASALGGAAEQDAARAQALRAQILDARARLRDVERGFRSDIDALERSLLFWTIWIPPLGVILAGLGFGLWRRRRPL